MPKRLSKKEVLAVTLVLFAFILGLSCKKSNFYDPWQIPIPASNLPAPPKELNLSPYYKKYVDAGGIAVVSCEHTQDTALWRARETILRMISNLGDSVKNELIQRGTRITIVSQYEDVVSLPERFNADLGRGSLSPFLPVAVAPEENVLCLRSPDITDTLDDILTHELAHLIHLIGLKNAVPGFDQQLQNLYNDAMSKGLYYRNHSPRNYVEYWAEGVGVWFNSRKIYIPVNGKFFIGTRDDLKDYDPQLYELISQYFTHDDVKNGCH